MKSINKTLRFLILVSVCFVTFSATFVEKGTAQITLLNPTGDGGFETGATFAANGWTLVNNGTNAWAVNNVAPAYAGSRGAFISNDAGVSYAYTINNSETSHFYRDVVIPAGVDAITLSFYWKGNVDLGYDRLLIYTAPTTTTPVAGAPVSNATAIAGATLRYTQTTATSAYSYASVALPAALAGTTVRLIFTWQNDNMLGTSPGIAIDNISLTCAYPPTMTLGANPSVCQGITNAPLSYSGTTYNPDQFSITWNAAALGAGFTNVPLTSFPASPISITVPAAAPLATYNATITVRNSLTGLSSPAYPFTVTVSAYVAVGASGAITGSNFVCQGQNGVAYSVAAIAGATGYVWTLPAGATIASGANTNSITVNFSGTSTSGSISVCGSAGPCLGVASPYFPIYGTIISDPINANGCPAIPVTFSITTTGAGLSYQWQEFSGAWANLSNGVNYSGVTTETLTINDPTGLSGRQYRCIVTGSGCPAATSAAATLTVIGSGLSGIKTVGTAGDYANLRLAFDAVNTQGLAGNLELQIISDITDNNAAVLNAYANCGALGYTIKIYPTGATRTLTANVAAGQVTLNGADFVTMDGRLNQSGAANSLIVINTSLDGSAVKFTADACNNVIKYCDLRGQETNSSNGVVVFGTATSTGNDDNLVDYCKIGSVNATTATPLYGVYSLGSWGKDNDHNTISNCEIYNFFNPDYASIGICILGGNTAWTLKSNSMYQTAVRAEWYFMGIYVNNTLGNDFVIDGNFVGGSAANCVGTWTVNGTSYNNLFRGIYLTCSTNGISVIKNNTIKGISFTTYGAGIQFAGIMVNTGRVDLISNTIGDNGTGSITLTVNDNSTDSPAIIPIYKDGDGQLLNNSIGSFTINGTVNDQCLFNAIQITGTLINDVVISGNTIGSATTANSIQTAAGAVPTVTIGGIYFGTGGNYNTTVSNNTIANITQRCTATMPFFVGLYNDATNGKQTVIGNTIRDISTTGTSTQSFTGVGDMSVITGIASINLSNGGHTIAQNTIHSLNATAAAAAVKVYGIMCHHDATGTTIAKNYIHSFNTASNTANQVGISAYSGLARINNNMIRLGYTSTGASVSSSPYMVGILQTSVSACTYTYNSVYLGGNDATAGAINTYAFRRTAGSSTLLNNIFYNARTGGGALHYAITTNNATVTSNYNDLFSSVAANLGSYNGGGANRTFAAWQAGTGQDANSRNENPIFNNPTGNATTVDLHLNPASPEGGRANPTTISIDIDNQQRSTTAPTIGADEIMPLIPGASAYGIFSPNALAGNVSDCEIYATGGTPGGLGIKVAVPADNNYANVFISAYQTITASNYSCMHTNMTFTTTDGSPDWLFGNGSSPSIGTASPMTTIQYLSTGRKNIIESVKLFKDFVNITMDTPDEGLILGAPAGAGCPTTYSYTSSVAGSPGFSYFWTVIVPTGCSANIAASTSSTTDVTFVNTTGVNQVFVLTLTITTECCGPLERVIRYITIYPSPLAPTVSGTTFALCTGGSQSVSVTGPDPTYSYEWYDASTGGALLGTGTSFTVNPVLSGTNSYWVQATNSYGCASPRTEVQITGNDTPAPTVAGASTCGVGDVTLSVNSPLAGATYNWYSGSCGGTLMQTSTSTSFTTSIAATTTFYVEVIPVGCGVSTCSAPVGTFITPPNPIVWLGAVGGLNNWFNAANWSSGCIPTCATNVRIPNLAIDPDIGFSATGDAACQDMDLQASAILSFSDTKAVLNICGNVTHSGVVTTGGVGLVKFMGSTAQTYSRTGTGDFHNVTLENSAATPTLTISNDLALDATGIFEFVSGKVLTGANYLVIKNTDVAAILGHSISSYVNGNLRRYVTTGAYDLPLGNTNAYELANIDITSNTGLTYLNTNFTNPANATGSGLPLLEATLSYDAVLNCGGINAATGHANGGVWTITPNAGTANYAMTLFGRNWDNAGTGHIVIRRVTAGPGAWTLAGTQVSNSNAGGLITSERSTYAGFSQFSIARTNDVLPVTMMSFTASCDNTSVDLRWATASETNSDFFAIERSANADIWEHIGNVDAAGNSNSARYYSYIDNDAFAGTNYYRLKQTDYNGGYKYYGPLSISCEDVVSPGISYYPNPFTSEIMVEVSNLVTDEASIIVYDAIGKKILEQKLSNISESNHKFTLDLGSLATGVYTVQFGSDVFSHYSKIVKY